MRQLTHWPQENIIYQPVLRQVSCCRFHTLPTGDPSATVIVSPSDHFVRDENRFMDAVAGALAVLKRHSGKSDWGTVASILRSLIEIGQLETFRMRLRRARYTLPGTPLHWLKSIHNLRISRPKRYILRYGPKLRPICLQISRSTYRSAQSFRQEGAAGSLSISRRVHDELQSTTMYISRLGD